MLCIIPARSGSKGIKNKNLKKIKKNKSLIELAFDIAKKSNLFDKIIVSTDSNYYKKYLKKKILINFLRPKKLSGDNVNDLDLIKFELKRYQKYYKKKFDYVCLLQPTSPFRKISDLKSCYKILKKGKLDAVWTITKVSNKFHPIKILKIENKHLKYFNKNGSDFINRQSLSNIYIRNGIAYFFSNKAILKYNKILPKKTGYFIINRKIINIDTLEDLQITKKLLNK